MIKSFFKIMFSASFRLVWMKRYENYGSVRKALILILMTALTAGSIGCAIWSISLYSSNVIMGIITSIIFIALAVVDFEFCMLYSTTAFRMARHGTVSLIGKKKKETTEEQIETSESEQTTTKPVKTNKALDYLIGFFGIIFGLGVIVVLVLLIYNAIKK